MNKCMHEAPVQNTALTHMYPLSMCDHDPRQHMIYEFVAALVSTAVV
jgi:hypothetical protein